MHFQHLRHATHRLIYGGKSILIDPVLSPKGTMNPIPGAPNGAPNPLTELPVPVETLCAYNLLLVTHLHQDHFDDAAGRLLPKDLQVICAPPHTAALQEKGFTNIQPCAAAITLDGIAITLTGGTHGTGATAPALNPVFGFILKAAGEPTVYITGDTVWCPEMEATLQLHQPELIICYGGAALYGGDIITMRISDFQQIRSTSPASQLAIIHMEGWNHCGLSRDAVRTWAHQENQEPFVWVPEDGEQMEL